MRAIGSKDGLTQLLREPSVDPNVLGCINRLFCTWENERNQAETEIELEASTYTGSALADRLMIFKNHPKFRCHEQVDEMLAKISQQAVEVRQFTQEITIPGLAQKDTGYDTFDFCDAFDNLCLDESDSE